jgi:hypothetical protein
MWPGYITYQSHPDLEQPTSQAVVRIKWDKVPRAYNVI